MLKLILFDFDDTLQDGTFASIEAEFKDISALFSMDLTIEDINTVLKHNTTLHSIYKGFLDCHNAKGYTCKISEKDFFKTYYGTIDGKYDHLTSLKEGVSDVLSFCRENGLKTGIVTNRDRNSLLRLLKHHGILEHFAVIVSLDDVARKKPDPEMIKKALKAVDVSADNALMIGDNPRDDVLAAKAAGVRIILYGKREPLPETSPDYRINHMADAIAIIQGKM